MNKDDKAESQRNFEQLLGKVLSVPKEKLDKALEQEKREKKPRSPADEPREEI